MLDAEAAIHGHNAAEGPRSGWNRRVRQGRSQRGGAVGSVLVVKRGAPSAEAV
jgi:hypothetical protein